MTKVTTSKGNEYEMDFAWMTTEGNCILQWHDDRPLVTILPEMLDLEWIKMVDEPLGIEVTNTTALDLYFATSRDGFVSIKFEDR